MPTAIARSRSEELIVELNAANQIIDERDEAAPFNSRQMLALLPETVVDRRTLLVLEIHDLFQAMDHTMTHAGSARLFHSLANPSESIELIHAKHDSFCELAGNDRLRNAIVEYLGLFHAHESELFKFLNAHMHPLLIYRNLKHVRTGLDKLLQAARQIPAPETVYLDSLIKSILSFSLAPARRLIAGPAFRTVRGISTRGEKGFFEPALRFRPGRLSAGSLLPLLPGTFFGSAWLLGFLDPALSKSMFFLTSWLSLLGGAHAALLKPMLDYETAILPMRQRLIESDRFASAIEAVAAIDELISFIVFCEELPYPSVIPEISNDPVHSFLARDLRNPILAKKSTAFVANDVNLHGNQLTFITGPNSGGKTTYCKTIAQNQILGQIGGPVVARQAKMNMADRITYQAPAFDTLNDTEGRFGTELKETRDIFLATTPQSLVVLDEIAEGTTSHEKLALSAEILNGFQAIGGNTLMVTHSFELVEQFQRHGQGLCLQVEFDGEQPTHRMTEGISRQSHALRVAKKIGFAPEDIRQHLRAHGYDKPKPPRAATPARPESFSCRRDRKKSK